MKSNSQDRIRAEMKEAALQIARPLKLYKIIDATVVYALVSVGDFSRETDRLMDGGEYAKALALDSLADEMLFSLSEGLAGEIEAVLRDKGLGVVRRESPGEQLPFEAQADILRVLGAEAYGLRLTEGMMLMPLKTITFVLRLCHGIGEGSGRHSCNGCSRAEDCKKLKRNT